MNRFWTRVVCALGLALAAVNVVYAHGGGTPRLTAAPVGPYSVFVWTEPEPWRADEVHVTLTVTTPPPDDAAINNDVVNNLLEQPIDGAEAIITFRPPNGGAPLVVAARPGTLNAFYLEADTVLPTAGLWTVEVDVTGPDGGGIVSFDVDVLSARGLNPWVLIGGGAILLAVIVLIAARARQPKGPPQATTAGTKKLTKRS
jgi:hypothetical protein